VWRVETDYCVGPNHKKDFPNEAEAVAYLEELQDDRHCQEKGVSGPRKHPRTGTWIADITVLGCVPSYAYAFRA
jgi:hypothetical protein